jgi:hypothetical protein
MKIIDRHGMVHSGLAERPPLHNGTFRLFAVAAAPLSLFSAIRCCFAVCA